MAYTLKISSLTAISGSAAALAQDLVRTERFSTMLRLFRATSPMGSGRGC
ncbi:hypothetical protein [Streptomyces sp. NBC_00564]|nr:hypothetical protein OG256_35855 [Streptomyces sp. NBC_00564]